MAKLTPQEIDELTRQFKKKTAELKDIYDKLAEAGEYPIDDDILDDVAGGFHIPADSYKR